MENRLMEVLSGQWGNYLLPFYWQHGESKELLEEGMEKIHDSGIGAVCVESRPHPGFLKDEWWRDLDIIMNKAKELDMRVWVLDDAHFPSGYCNGEINETSPYRKIYLDHYCVDVVGPRKGLSFMVRLDKNETYVGAVLGKRERKNTKKLTNLQNISSYAKDGKIYVDIPEGLWSVVIIKTTDRGTGRKNYINSIDHDSVRFFIDTVYEAHYAHYKEDFGQTFAGFFSDEPEIGNCLGEYRFQAVVGQKEMRLPWSPVVEKRLKDLWGSDYVINLIHLWAEEDLDFAKSNITGRIRSQFMDLISEQYGKNFCLQIGDWCREHGVEYIGHVIEDGGTHSHVGLGTGHFFRALWGQDMSGIDVVLQQIRPELDDCEFFSIGGTSFYDGELFHYGLAKMGVSLGQLDPKKKGRTMCEVFGAYGWAEGLKMMKWLLDHMLVNGVNYYVPHAFTMKDFPDPDCPPHFYARGNNPQYPYFKDLMDYTNRISHLIQNGIHAARVGILYTAEQEWMGEFRAFEKDARILTRAQIDYEIVPTEYLLTTKVTDGTIPFGGKTLSALIIPGSACIGEELACWIEAAREKGFFVGFSARVPKVLCADGSLKEMEAWNLLLIEEDSLPEALRPYRDIELSTNDPGLRFYHYIREEGEYYLFFNEGTFTDVNTRVHFDEIGLSDAVWYDPWLNKVSKVVRAEEKAVDLSLSTYEMQILFVPETKAPTVKEAVNKEAEIIMIPEDSWSVSAKNGVTPQKVRIPFAEEETKLDFVPALGDMSVSERLPYFTGTFIYETKIDGNAFAGKQVELSLGEVYETAVVTVNGQSAGVRIAPPYTFNLTNILTEGENTLTVKVINTLVHDQRDFLSMTMPMEPSGLIGPVCMKVSAVIE